MDILFWGATGQSKVLRELLGDTARVVAVVDRRAVDPPFPDVPLLVGDAAFESWLSARTSPTHFLVAIGGEHGRDRVAIQRALVERGLAPHIAVHRTAFVASNAVIGEGSQILAQAAVCADARLGDACIVNTAASVDHECVLGDGVHVAPGARLAGLVSVDSYSMIGTGAIVLPRLHIGEGAIVGAGAVVTRDVAPGSVVAGNPARPLR